MQLVSIEEAKGLALTDKTLSATQQSKCPLPKGKNIFYALDNMSVANKRKEQKDLQRSIYIQSTYNSRSIKKTFKPN